MHGETIKNSHSPPSDRYSCTPSEVTWHAAVLLRTPAFSKVMVKVSQVWRYWHLKNICFGSSYREVLFV